MAAGATITRFLSIFGLTASVLIVPGCATRNNVDPFEGFNRSMFQVDRTLDRFILNPVVQVYDKVLPTPVHTGVNNFFSNTFEPARVVNDLLQLDIADALNDMARFFVNTTAGIGGLFDLASKMGMIKHANDFGITLAKWGVRRSAYLYIPCLGPMTVRDTFSVGVDYFILNPISYIPTDKIRLGLVGLGKVHYRWRWLPARKVIEDSFDPYVFVRDVYLQKRQAMINEVVQGHHAAEDTFIHDVEEEPIITEEDRLEAHHQRSQSQQQLSTPTPTPAAPPKTLEVPQGHYPVSELQEQFEQALLGPLLPLPVTPKPGHRVSVPHLPHAVAVSQYSW